MAYSKSEKKTHAGPNKGKVKKEAARKTKFKKVQAESNKADKKNALKTKLARERAEYQASLARKRKANSNGKRDSTKDNNSKIYRKDGTPIRGQNTDASKHFKKW